MLIDCSQCLQCQETFLPKAYRFKGHTFSNDRQFCSGTCRGKWTFQNKFPMWDLSTLARSRIMKKRILFKIYPAVMLVMRLVWKSM